MNNDSSGCCTSLSASSNSPKDNVNYSLFNMAEIDWRGGYPPTINHTAEANRAAEIASDIIGSDKVHMDLPPSMAAEDFAFMLEARKGAYIWLGAGPAQEGRMLHNTGYDFNDSILPVGTSYWVKLVESELAS